MVFFGTSTLKTRLSHLSITKWWLYLGASLKKCYFLGCVRVWSLENKKGTRLSQKGLDPLLTTILELYWLFLVRVRSIQSHTTYLKKKIFVNLVVQLWVLYYPKYRSNWGFRPQFRSFSKMSDPIFWGGLNKSTPTKVSSRLPKNIFCENVPMSVPKGVVNIKTCCDFFITQF